MSGQDRESYSDDQDRESYTVDMKCGCDGRPNAHIEQVECDYCERNVAWIVRELGATRFGVRACAQHLNRAMEWATQYNNETRRPRMIDTAKTGATVMAHAGWTYVPCPTKEKTA